MDSTPRTTPDAATETDRDAIAPHALEAIRASLRGLRFGSVNIIIQDGVVIQIDRTEKHRLQSRRANQRGE